jgi:uncharacterized protein YndB with AHSA1/START domain
VDPLTITRSVRIDAAADVVWGAVGDADGLAGWLGARVDVDLVPGAAGAVVAHDGGTRQLVVTEVAEGRRVGFAWWDDERPDDVSQVVIAVEDDGDGARVTVTETLDPGAVGALGGRASALLGAEVGDLAGAGARWDARLQQLVGLVSPALAPAWA